MSNIVKKDIHTLANRETWVNEIDVAIDETTAALITQIKEDRERAERMYLELLSLFNQGKNSPEDLEQLNKAQELVQSTTDKLQQVFATLAKIKIGGARVQIANLNSSNGDTYTKADIIDIIEKSIAQDNTIGGADENTSNK